MAQLAEKLRPAVPSTFNHPVIDLTGLRGAYDFVLSWTQSITPPAGISAGQLAPDAPLGDLTLFEAADRQLGLKISEQKHLMPVVVVDYAERMPSGNYGKRWFSVVQWWPAICRPMRLRSASTGVVSCTSLPSLMTRMRSARSRSSSRSSLTMRTAAPPLRASMSAS